MFMRIDRRFMAKCFGQMQELGIYPGQIPVLGLLAHKDGLSQREIAEKLHINHRLSTELSNAWKKRDSFTEKPMKKISVSQESI